MTNWKNIAKKAQAEKYVLPPGWTAAAKIAEDLDCPLTRVAEYLRPAIENKTVEVRRFSVYDRETDRVVPVTAYREVVKRS